MIRITPIVLLLIFLIDLSSIFIVGRFTGGLMAFLLLILSELIGISLFVNSLKQLATSNQKSISQVITNSKLILVSFIFLLPGFISDIIGIFILIKAKQDEKKMQEREEQYAYKETYNYYEGEVRRDNDFDEFGVSKAKKEKEDKLYKKEEIIIDVKPLDEDNKKD